MFEKILSSIGIGSAKVNTILFEEEIIRGENVKGEVHVFGGRAEQSISEIYIHIDTEFHRNEEDLTEFLNVTEPILEIKITEPIVIHPGEEKIIPFSFVLPYYTPTTFHEQKIHIQTELNITFLIHPIETHDFQVRDPLIDDILAYLKEHGFSHSDKSGLCRHKIPSPSNPTHCLQTFELINADGIRVNFVGNEEQIFIYFNHHGQINHYTINREDGSQKQLEQITI